MTQRLLLSTSIIPVIIISLLNRCFVSIWQKLCYLHDSLFLPFWVFCAQAPGGSLVCISPSQLERSSFAEKEIEAILLSTMALIWSKYEMQNCRYLDYVRSAIQFLAMKRIKIIFIIMYNCNLSLSAIRTASIPIFSNHSQNCCAVLRHTPQHL
jgi:hypothetical protein